MTNQPPDPAASSESENSSSAAPSAHPDQLDQAEQAAAQEGASSPSSADERLGLRVRQQLATRSEDAAKRAPAPGKPLARPDDEEESSESRGGLPPRDKGPRTPVPSKRAPLSAELEQELEEALGSTSLDQLIEKQSPATEPIEQLDSDTRRRAPVVRIHKDNVFFALGGRNEGVASLRQFKQPPNIGDQLDVAVTGYNAEDGLYELSIAGASISVGDWSDISVGALVEARVTGSNAGGLECTVNNIRAFIPASQISMYRVENLAEFVDQKFVCVVTEANPDRRNLVLSRRSVLEREREDARQALLDGIEPGQTREGIVRSIRDFGAFVDLGGIDGLIHISQLSWDRVNDPREVVEEGKRVQVRVEKVDKQTGKISLSYRSLQDHPWETAPQQFPVGTIVKGVVTRIAKFGAFVKIAPGIEGLIHISELAHYRVAQVSNVVNEGQEVEVKVVSLDADEQRIGLSLKAMATAPAAQAAEESPEEEIPTPQKAPRSNIPLKGGVDHGTGGESFGLKW